MLDLYVYYIKYQYCIKILTLEINPPQVEQRYRQYRQQMQLVVAAFEAAAGPSSGKTYTALALRTISRQFRCLRDAITTQIKGARKSLGEDMEGGNGGGSSRLRAVEQQLRQQRALQQLGMIQPNAWRPQRGLPERSVSVLRAWLFEHFLHPYVNLFFFDPFRSSLINQSIYLHKVFACMGPGTHVYVRTYIMWAL